MAQTNGILLVSFSGYVETQLKQFNPGTFDHNIFMVNQIEKFEDVYRSNVGKFGTVAFDCESKVDQDLIIDALKRLDFTGEIWFFHEDIEKKTTDFPVEGCNAWPIEMFCQFVCWQLW